MCIWTTDESATGAVRYGTTPGVYTQSITHPLFDQVHSLTLTGLTVGQTCYFSGAWGRSRRQPGTNQKEPGQGADEDMSAADPATIADSDHEQG